MLDRNKISLVDKGQLADFIAAGFTIIPLEANGKRPIHKNWTKRPYGSRKVLEKHDGNFGLRLGDTDLVVDVDVIRDGITGLKKLCRDLGINLDSVPRTNTGGGGYHYFFRKPAGIRVVDSLKEYPGVEFKSVGRQVVAPFSIHPSGRRYELEFTPLTIAERPDAPEALLDLITRPERPEGSQGGGELTPEKAAELLALLPAESFASNEAWFEIMCALHHATDGDAREEFLDWSETDPTYADKRHVNGARWDSLTVNPGASQITVATLYKALKDAGHGDMIPRGDPADDFEDAEIESTGILDDPKPQSLAKDLTDIKPESVHWLWNGWLARGHMTMIAGYPGQSKSQLSLRVAATISNGGAWPDGSETERGSVLLLSSEDHVASTIIPRLMAVGADLTKIKYVPSTVKDGDTDRRRTLSLRDDLRALNETARQIGDVRLIIIDPVSAYMGVKVDAFKSTDVRGFFAPVTEWAEKTGIATLLISHFNKSGKGTALNQIIDSQAFTAMCRVVGIIGPEIDPMTGDTDRKVLACAKNNLAKFPSSLVYRIESATVAKNIATSRIEWDGQTKATAEDIVNPTREKVSKVDAAETLLLDLLENGPMLRNEIKARADELGHAWATIRRAADNLNIVMAPEAEKGKGRGVKAFRWTLPEESEAAE